MTRFTRFMIWYTGIASVLTVFGLILGALDISPDRHQVLTNILGPDGIVFGFVLRTMLYAFFPISVVWVISQVAFLRKKNR